MKIDLENLVKSKYITGVELTLTCNKDAIAEWEYYECDIFKLSDKHILETINTVDSKEAFEQIKDEKRLAKLIIQPGSMTVIADKPHSFSNKTQKTHHLKNEYQIEW